MLAIDLRNAFEGRFANNFSVVLLRLIARADGDNKNKLRLGYPVHVKAVEIYKGDCPYVDEARTIVDWDGIADRAYSTVRKLQGERGGCVT